MVLKLLFIYLLLLFDFCALTIELNARVLEPVSFAELMKNRETYGSDDDDGVESPTGGFDWAEPSMQLCYSASSTSVVPRTEKVYDAFHLLQTEPSVQVYILNQAKLAT